MTQIPESARRRLQMHAVSEHPDADLLTAFAEQSLSADERERVLLHLAACATCREVVSLAAPEQRVPVEVTTAESWFRWPILRWTAVAATVIVVGTAVSVVYQRNRGIDVAVPATETAPRAQSSQPPANANGEFRDSGARTINARKAPAAPEHKREETEAAKNERKLPAAATTADGRLAASPVAIPSIKSAELHALGSLGKLDAKAADQEGVRKDAPEKKSVQNGVVGGLAGGNKETMADKVAFPPPPPPPSPPQGQAAAQNEAVMAIPAAPAANAYAQQEAAAAKKQAVVAAAPASAPVTLSRAKSLTLPRWRVSASGAVERSSDGVAWEKIEIDPAVTFRAMSSNAGDLWVGGSGGALFHSADAGRSWSRVKVGDDGMWVSDAVTAVDFSSTRNGIVTTQSGAVWMTQDGGHSWERRQ